MKADSGDLSEISQRISQLDNENFKALRLAHAGLAQGILLDGLAMSEPAVRRRRSAGESNGGGGGSRTRVRKHIVKEIYMRIRF